MSREGSPSLLMGGERKDRGSPALLLVLERPGSPQRGEGVASGRDGEPHEKAPNQTPVSLALRAPER